MYLAFQIVPIQYIILILILILNLNLNLIPILNLILEEVVMEDKDLRNMFYYLRYLILGNILMLHFALIHYNMLLF